MIRDGKLHLGQRPRVSPMPRPKCIEAVDGRGFAMEALGYEVMGEYGIPGRRYFRKENEMGVRTHHIHAFEVGSPEVERHLAFRDYMIAHPQDAQRYSELKRQLARAHRRDIGAYMDGKDGFIKEIDRRAALWRRCQRR